MHETATKTPEPPTISALPTPTREEILTGEIETLKLSLKTEKEQYEDLLRVSKETLEKLNALHQEHQATLETLESVKSSAEAAAKLAALEIEKRDKEIAEKETDRKLAIAELETVHKNLKDTERERDDLAAFRDEWSGHPFFGTLLILNRQTAGLLCDDLTKHMDDVLAACNDTGKAGKVTLALAIKPSDERDGALVAATQLKATLPKADADKAYLFMDNGKPTEEDPRQKKLIDVPRSRKPKGDSVIEAKLAKAKVVTEPPPIEEGDKEIYEAAEEWADIEGGKVSVAALQRKMGISYVQAKRVHSALVSRGKAQAV